MLKRILLFIIYAIFFIGCAYKSYDDPNTISITLPKQDLSNFVESEFWDSNKDLQEALQGELKEVLKKEYLEKFFAPFSSDPQPLSAIKWGLDAAYRNLGYGENLLPYTQEEIQQLEFEADFNNYPSAQQKGIITRSTNVRVLPTHKPRFYNPKQAGEGFPFDYWQNSYIYAGTPILITHYSHSKAWAYVESGFVSGWVSVLNIGILKEKEVKKLLQTQEFLVVKEDKTPLNAKGAFLESARIGMLLPLLKEYEAFFEAKFYTRDSNGYAKAQTITLSKAQFARFPMAFSSRAMAELAQGIVGEKYGWGGMLGNRDCSMLLRDIFSNFAVYLPRNSQAQIRIESQLSPSQLQREFIDLSTQNGEEKKALIKKYGIPFATLFGMRGHILLYLGEKDGEIYALHDVWGLRTLQNETQEGRKILGKIVITSLEIGKNVEGIEQDKLLLYQIYGFRNLFNAKSMSHE